MSFFTRTNNPLNTSADLVALGIKNLLTLSQLSSDVRSVPKTAPVFLLIAPPIVWMFSI